MGPAFAGSNREMAVKHLMMATALSIAALTMPALAQAPAPAEHDSHHPADSAKAAPVDASQPGVNAPEGGMGNMPMMGMMNDMKAMMSSMSMMNTMGMMRSMGMMGPGVDGMGTMDRVEGRIAFLRTELKITDAQLIPLPYQNDLAM